MADLKIYWIIVDGQPHGPFTPDEIAAKGVVSPTLRVWRKGLSEWVLLPQVPELVHLLGPDWKPTDADVEATAEPAETIEVEAVEVEPQAKTEPEPQPQPQPETPRQQAFSWGATATAGPAQPAAESEPMPPTYLPWNVLATVCCCIPLGLIGVIFSSQVSRKYLLGDIEGARRASERAAWCFIIAFTLGLVCWPFQLLFSGL